MRSKWWLVLAAWGMAGVVLAMTPAKVEYSADETMETAEFAFDGAVAVSGDKERREQLIEGMRQITITRHDKKVVWTLLPEQQMYMEMKLGEGGSGQGDLSEFDIEQTTVGQEEVNGVATTKSKIVMTARNGDKMGGFWWVSRDGIVVKLDVIGMTEGSKMRMKKELRNVKLGRQDPALFEIPAGYEKMSMLNMLMGGAAAGTDGEDTPADGGGQAETPPAEKKKSGFGLKNIIDMVR